jgi:hypothetical protein
MATDDLIRASDADREAVVATLREAYMAGRLTMDEFDERMSAAYNGRTWGDLRELSTDLPVQPVLGADLPGGQLAATSDLRLPAAPGEPGTDEADQVDDPALSPVPARRRPVGVLVPLAIWALLVVHNAVAPGTVFLLIAVFAVISVMASIRRR